jgi:hypothetical protein
VLRILCAHPGSPGVVDVTRLNIDALCQRDRRSKARLPVDAYYPRHGLVIEYRERQHEEAVPFFDRRQTLSGVNRGEQRQRYDRRREEEIPRNGLRLLVIRPADLAADRRGRLLRKVVEDELALRELLDFSDSE